MVKKKKAVRNPITGKVEYYEGTKTVGLRNPLTSKIEKRVSKAKASKRGVVGRTYTMGDAIDDAKKKKKKGLFW